MIRIFRLILAGMTLAIVALASAIITMHFAIHGAEVQVPDLQGLTIEEAVHRTASLDLNLGIDSKYYSADIPSGRVIAQAPPPGAIVRREFRVRAIESLGPQRVAIPNVCGQPERIAAIEIRRLNLDLEEMAEMPYAGAPPGTVLAQNPQSGAGGAQRPSVSLLVSSAADVPIPAFVMPRLLGMPFDAATGLLAKAGLKILPGAKDEVNSPNPPDPQDLIETNDTSPPGTVLGQTPPAGYRVDSNTEIAFTVSQ